MDKITSSCVAEFISQHEIPDAGESENFEKFCQFCLISKEYNGQFSVEEIGTDLGTQGIDGIGIIVNGKLIDDTDEVDDLIESNRSLEATFVFIQSKTSSSFQGSEIGNFGFAVKQFFTDNSSLFPGPKMQAFLELKNYIYDLAPDMTKGNPLCKLYYVTAGQWSDDPSLKAVIEQTRKELSDTNLFSEVQFEPCDAALIQKYYRKTKEAVSATFSFEKRVTLPEIEGIREAYFGYTPFKEFQQLISNEYGVIRNIFYDNVRDFLGENPVNKKIDTTLKGKKFELFGVLNNVVTIVAESLNATGDKFTITDYQVVNGCQTSHVLFNNKDIDGINRVAIPLRLIVTDRDDIKNEITKATNSQTEIKPDQLEALSEFQKNLEQYYNSIEGDGRLYYERRTNQYSNDNRVIKTKIVSIRFQIKAFAAMFLDNPHLVSGYYGTIAQRLGDKIFRPDQQFSPYYTSGLAYYRLETLFRTNLIDSKYKKVRYHLLMISRIISNNQTIPSLSSGRINDYCAVIINKLNNQDECLSLFQRSIDLAEGSGIDIEDKYQLKQREKTQILLRSLSSAS